MKEKRQHTIKVPSPPPLKYWEQAKRENPAKKKVKMFDIPLRDINVERQVIRENINDEHVIELSGSMAKHGLLEPIVVEKEDSHYVLIAGFNRVVSAHRLNWETIPACVRDHDPNVPIKALALTENIVRRDLSLAEECLAVKQLYEGEGLSTSQICSYVGKSRQWVERRLMAPNLPAEIREALFEGDISLGNAEILAGVEDIGARNDILRRVVFGKLSVSETKNIISLWSETANVHEAIQQGLETSQKQQEEKKNTRKCDACGENRDFQDLQPIWVCREGCEEEKLRDNIENRR